MRFRVICLVLALLSYGGALLTGTGQRRSIPDLGRDLVRPILLPFLWHGLEVARAEGSAEEYAARGRLLLQLLPGWADGHIHVAGRLAFDASLGQERRQHPEAALDRLLAALDLLERALGQDLNRPDEILVAMANFLVIRCEQSSELAAAFTRRFKEDPNLRADSYLARIEGVESSKALGAQRVFYHIRGIPGAIRRGDVAYAGDLLEFAIRGLPRIHDQELAKSWLGALGALRSHLDLAGGEEISVEDLADFESLESIVEALRLNPVRKE